MSDKNQKPDWDPRSLEVLHDPLGSFDRMRAQCPLAYSNFMQWSVFRHQDVLQILEDHQRFSNQVSQHRSVPNGMDPPEHTPYRQLVEPFFTAERMAAFEPECRQISHKLISALGGRQKVDVVTELGENFSLAVQCRFLGWPESLQQPLRQWMHDNHKATLAADRPAMAEIAERFGLTIHELLETRRTLGSLAPNDVTNELLRAQVDGQPLAEADIVSLLRNWTAGEVGTITASVSIILAFLAQHRELQQELRQHPQKLPEAIDEILRRHGPLTTNRRRATQDITLGGRHIRAGELLTINWVSANRDENVFPNPDQFQWGRDQSKNLLYGAGIHVCPGAPLARLELRIFFETLLAQTTHFCLSHGCSATPAHYPTGGFDTLYLDFDPTNDNRL